MNTILLSGAVTVVSTLLLSGCFEKQYTTQELCDRHAQLQCQELNMNDSQCRVARTDVIWQRFDVLRDPSDDNLIDAYYKTASYRQCLELASQINTLTQTDVKRKRYEALVASIDELDALTKRLSDSRSADALYFLWSQLGDKEAQRQFLQLEGSKQVETAHLQYALATYYVQHDREKTLHFLQRALELTSADQVNPDIVKTLASLYQQMGDKEHAYLWTQVAKHMDIAVASDKQLQRLIPLEADTEKQLKKDAKVVYQAIMEGDYKASMTHQASESVLATDPDQPASES
ncbi:MULTISPECIES: DUF2989 domain-containing protein [unclassified Vibrio]|uniref:DUF2989 domain-containing protein n=1 Tax=Vibrio sp. HB236076 TaxID=3232307 RepID=A0AB39HDK0_9VIBR|nr:DUF2989 domain-containing protein [Vibrio sp. HB161653]MDP5254714.1 DUF2989 domain-containing protein [Vibrio sp. HB161653]